MLSFFWINANLFSGLVFSFEFYSTINFSEESVISALTNIVARVKLGASLSYQDAACAYKLTVTGLDSKAFRLGIAAVLGTTYTLFTCHVLTSLFRSGFNGLKDFCLGGLGINLYSFCFRECKEFILLHGSVSFNFLIRRSFFSLRCGLLYGSLSVE